MNKRDKYLTACPDIDIINIRNLFQSYHKWKLFETIKPIIINNSLAYETHVRFHLIPLFKISVSCISRFYIIGQYFTNSNFYLTKFIQSITQKDVTAWYKERGRILSTIKTMKDGILDCMINISYLQEKFSVMCRFLKNPMRRLLIRDFALNFASFIY